MATAVHPLNDASPWAPLRVPVFRAFWMASLASNFGTWIHEIGAGWLMTELNASPEMVSAVRTCMALPIVLLAVPAGVLADRVDRRRLLLGTQLALFLTATVLGALTFADRVTPTALLGLTFVMGMGMVLHVPTWQASMPELVPKNQLPRAVALGSVSFNLARAFGPAVGGFLIAAAGVWSTFTLNAVSFMGVVLVLTFWRRRVTESSRGQTFRRSLFQGVWYAFRKKTMRHVLFGVLLFVLPASSLWALLPLLAREQLGWGPKGFGLLVGMMGGGAVVASWLLPRVQQRLGADRTVAAAMLVYGCNLFVISRVDHTLMVVASTLMMGGGWMMTLTTLNATAQVTLPRQLRARGMGCYLTAMAVSMSAGSLLWGQIAGITTLPSALAIAAMVLCINAGFSLCFRFERALD